MLYKHYDTLKRLDSVVVTKKEFDNVIVWNEVQCRDKLIRKLKPENPRDPPEQKDEEQDG